MIAPVRPIALNDIREARERIAGTVLRTPLVKLDTGGAGPEIYLKLENLQPTNAYKIRGAANAVARLSDEERARGRSRRSVRRCASSARSRKLPRPMLTRCTRAGRHDSPAGRRHSSTARAARA